MNRKLTLILLALSVLLLLSSCGRIGRVMTVTEDAKADARTEQIISALKEKDVDALKSLFSKKALDEADDFEKDAEYLFEFVEGSIETWEVDGWSSSMPGIC